MWLKFAGWILHSANAGWLVIFCYHADFFEELLCVLLYTQKKVAEVTYDLDNRFMKFPLPITKWWPLFKIHKTKVWAWSSTIELGHKAVQVLKKGLFKESEVMKSNLLQPGTWRPNFFNSCRKLYSYCYPSFVCNAAEFFGKLVFVCWLQVCSQLIIL